MNMKRKKYFTAILGMALTAAMFLAGCDLTTNPDKKGNSGTGDNGSSGTGNSGTSNGGELNGTWKKGVYEIIITGNDYTMKYNENNYGKGTISYSVDDGTFTFKSTHAWRDSGWISFTETTTGTLSYGDGNTLVISSINNSEYESLKGSWTRGSGTGNGSGTPQTEKTIIITGFPGSTYSGKFAMIILSPSSESIAKEVMTAGGITEVSATTLSFPLYSDFDTETRWNGTGENLILLGILDVFFDQSTEEVIDMDLVKMFFYSPGVTPNSTWSNIPKYNITEKTSTILFNTTNFYDITDQFPEDMFDGYF
jgi:hypothetical protein